MASDEPGAVQSGQFLPQHLHGSAVGFHEYHATTIDNPTLPKRPQNETLAAWTERRKHFLADLIKDNDPLVYAQEYLAEFVDWAGVAFFARDKLLHEDRPVPFPARCDGVFAVIDTASKTGTEHDATAVTYFARDQNGRPIDDPGLGHRPNRRSSTGNLASDSV